MPPLDFFIIYDTMNQEKDLVTVKNESVELCTN